MGSNSMMIAALWYAQMGWRVFPVRENSKEPGIKAWQKLATTDKAQIESWWSYKSWNVGLACGEHSGIFVVDVDQGKNDGEASLEKAQSRLGVLPKAPEQMTGGGGRQIFFAYPSGHDMRNSASKIGPGLDTRGSGGFVVLPPSMHPSGTPYRWKLWPNDVALPDLPSAWVKKLERKKQTTVWVPVNPLPCVSDRELRRLLNQIERQSEGARHCTLFAVASDVLEKQSRGLVPPGNHDANLLQSAMIAGLPEPEAARVISDARRVKRGG